MGTATENSLRTSGKAQVLYPHQSRYFANHGICYNLDGACKTMSHHCIFCLEVVQLPPHDNTYIELDYLSSVGCKRNGEPKAVGVPESSL